MPKKKLYSYNCAFCGKACKSHWKRKYCGIVCSTKRQQREAKRKLGRLRKLSNQI